MSTAEMLSWIDGATRFSSTDRASDARMPVTVTACRRVASSCFASPLPFVASWPPWSCPVAGVDCSAVAGEEGTASLAGAAQAAAEHQIARLVATATTRGFIGKLP
jgi:hypothetical protein